MDCLLGKWTEWGECDNLCGPGNQTRTRFVQLGACGGVECPEDGATATENRQCKGTEVINCQVSRTIAVDNKE